MSVQGIEFTRLLMSCRESTGSIGENSDANNACHDTEPSCTYYQSQPTSCQRLTEQGLKRSAQTPVLWTLNSRKQRLF